VEKEQAEVQKKKEKGDIMLKMEIEVKSHLSDVLRAELSQRLIGLNQVGVQAEGYAKEELNTTDPRRVDTGLLRNSITHQVRDNCSVLIGTNVFYALYVHEGTGIYGNNPKNAGGKTWWVYVKGSAKGRTSGDGKRYTRKEAARVMMYLRDKGLDAWMTEGMRPNRFLVNAMTKNRAVYKAILTQYYKGG
jgi:phage gpG-like protein